MRRRTLTALLLALHAAAFGQATPVGLWKTVDDATHKERSLVRIEARGGVLEGRIERLLATDTPNTPNTPNTPEGQRCERCTDDRKDQPLVGLVILRDLRPDADDSTLWNGGDVLDPENGKVYRVRLRLEGGGQRLGVRGYIGTPLLGRSQTWVRVP